MIQISLVSMAFPYFSLLILIIVFRRYPHKAKKFLPLYAITMGMIGYCYNVPSTANPDLVRYFAQIDSIRGLTLAEALSQGDAGITVHYFFMWIVSRFNDNHILPLVCNAILYTVPMYIAIDSMDSDEKRLVFVFLFQIICIPLYECTGNIRNTTTFALITLAVYRDYVKGKRNIITYLLYILPCFIHITGFVVVLLSILPRMIKKRIWLMALAAVALPFVTVWSYEHLYSLSLPGNFGLIFRRAVFKAWSSTMSESEYAISVNQSGYVRVCRVVTLIILAILMFLTNRYYMVSDENKKRFLKFHFLFCAITIAWILLRAVKYWIFAVGAFITSAPTIAYYLKKWDDNDKLDRVPLVIMGIMCAFRLGLEVYYMSQGRVDFADFSISFLINNIYLVLYRMVKGFLIA